jgi:hypothetical protein
MLARFVAIPSDRLEEIKASPDRIEELFAADTSAFARMAQSPAVQERLRRQTPQMLKAQLERLPPPLQEQMLRSFGITEADLDNPNVGEVIAKRVNERMAALHQKAPKTGKSSPNGVSLDKAWHGLHYLLCGSAEPTPGPLGQAVLGGREAGDDLGYGPARYFTPKETAVIAQALQAPGLEAQLHSRFDGAKMLSLGIYPGGWPLEGIDWLIDAFHKLRDFYIAASTAGHAVVTILE